MAEDSDGRRRTRRRATAPQGPATVAVTAPVAAPTPDPTTPLKTAQPPKHTNTRGGRPSGPRGERDLAGSGRSQVGPTGAMRARDLNRPTADDLAEAEAEIEIVRRHWSPIPDAVEQPRTPPRRRRS